MARITVEDCLEHESNRFILVKLASVRAKQLLDGKAPVTDTKGNRAIVSALREIAVGKVHFAPEVEETSLPSGLAPAAGLPGVTGQSSAAATPTEKLIGAESTPSADAAPSASTESSTQEESSQGETADEEAARDSAIG